jgi:hypothetical protein
VAVWDEARGVLIVKIEPAHAKQFFTSAEPAAARAQGLHHRGGSAAALGAAAAARPPRIRVAT